MYIYIYIYIIKLIYIYIHASNPCSLELEFWKSMIFKTDVTCLLVPHVLSASHTALGMNAMCTCPGYSFEGPRVLGS